MSLEILPPLGDLKQRAFKANPDRINKISALLGLYILLVLYPAYGLLRLFWSGDASTFSGSSFALAILIAASFSAFARRSIRQYLIVN